MQKRKKVVVAAMVAIASASIINAAVDTTISHGDQPVLTVNGTTLTNQDLFDNLRVFNGFTAALEAIDSKVMEEHFGGDARLSGIIDELYAQREAQAQQAEQPMQDLYNLYGAANKDEFVQRSGIRLNALRRLAAINQSADSIFTNQEVNFVYDNFFSGTGQVYRILISPDVSSTQLANLQGITDGMQASLQEAQGIIQRINDGELTFETAVAEYSADKTNNGYLGTFDINSAREAGMTNLVANQVFALGNEQVIAHPILTQFGYEIYMIRYTQEKPALEDVRDQVNARLFQIYANHNPFIQNYALDLFRSANNINFHDSEFARTNANMVIQNRLSYLQFNPNAPQFGF